MHDMGHWTNRLSVILPNNNIIRLVRIFAPYALVSVIIDPVFAPGLAVIKQLEMLTKERMKRMSDFEGLLRTVR